MAANEPCEHTALTACVLPTVNKPWPAAGMAPAGHAALGSLAAMSKALVVFGLLVISFWSPREALERT